MYKFLVCYPFTDPRVRLVEGFAVYDGVLNDEPGTLHRGIDYVLTTDETYVPFDVFTMHEGVAFQGQSDTWGTFVIVHSRVDDALRYSTVYAHLDRIMCDIAPQFMDDAGERRANTNGTHLAAGTNIGVVGTTGRTHGIPQLHIELHEANDTTGERRKLDPYGIDDRASPGKYPQPGTPLVGLRHFWATDTPPFASL